MIDAATSVRDSMQSLSTQDDASESTLDGSDLLKRQNELLRRAQPLKARRYELIKALAAFDTAENAAPPSKENPLSLQKILIHLEPHQRVEVDEGLRDLRDKMTRYRALALSNQTVAIYALDFYSAMLGQSPANDPYNAHGQTTRQWQTATNVQRSC